MSAQLLSIAEAADRLGVAKNTVLALIERNELPSIVLGRRRSGAAMRRMVAESDLIKFIEDHREGRNTDGAE